MPYGRYCLRPQAILHRQGHFDCNLQWCFTNDIRDKRQQVLTSPHNFKCFIKPLIKCLAKSQWSFTSYHLLADRYNPLKSDLYNGGACDFMLTRLRLDGSRMGFVPTPNVDIRSETRTLLDKGRDDPIYPQLHAAASGLWQPQIIKL